MVDNRLTLLIWAVGMLAGLNIVVLGVLFALSYQVGQVNGQLSVLIAHAQLK